MLGRVSKQQCWAVKRHTLAAVPAWSAALCQPTRPGPHHPPPPLALHLPQSLKSPQKPKLGDDDMAAVINDGLELYAQVGAARAAAPGLLLAQTTDVHALESEGNADPATVRLVLTILPGPAPSH